jgi:hypothetical protein
LNGIPAIGVSLDSFHNDADFSVVSRYFGNIFEKLMNGFSGKKGVYYNVNFPDIPADQIKGVKVGRQGMGRWVKEFVEWDARNRKTESRTVVPYRLDVPEDFVPLHPPVLVKSSWREAKKVGLTEQAKKHALSEQVRASAIAKANSVSKVGGKLQKVAGTPHKRPEAMTMQNNNFVVKGKKITATRK